jgi:hypothetical protein
LASGATVAECKTCDKPLGYGNKSGYCGQHHNSAPELVEKRNAAQRMRYASDPILRERIRQNSIRVANFPAEQERRRNAPHLAQMAAKGRAGITREGIERRNKAISAARMAWCPPELRDLAKTLTGKKIPLAEVKVMIAEQHEKDMADFRRKLGAV